MREIDSLTQTWGKVDKLSKESQCGALLAAFSLGLLKREGARGTREHGAGLCEFLVEGLPIGLAGEGRVYVCGGGMRPVRV